jgi:hypothetical protein
VLQTPLRDEDGYNGEELNAAEERLGFKLPAALRGVHAVRQARRPVRQDEFPAAA